jgi:hypothetical protein
LTLRTEKVVQKNDKDDEDEDCEDNEDEEDKILYRERKFNYITELATFLDNGIVWAHLQLLKEENILKNFGDVNFAVSEFLRRVCEDLKASWIFF